MRLYKRVIVGFIPVLIILLATLLVACGPATRDQQVFVSAQEGIKDLTTLDPALVTDQTTITAIDMVFTGLVQLNDKSELQGQLAQSWDCEADGVTWTFHLHKNLKFSDGTPLTSKDVAYSINRALQPNLHSPTALTYLLIKDADKLYTGKIKTLIGGSIKTPDDNTIIIRASTKGVYFVDALTYPTSYVVEKNLIDRYGNTKFTEHLGNGGGSGPFIVQSYTHEKQIVFVPNHNYNGPLPQIHKVVMPFYSQLNTGYKAYQAGQIDNTAIPTANYADAKAHPSEFHRVAMLALRYYAMNYLVKPFDNIHIRQAFALALNKDALVHAVRKDIDIATNHIVPQGMWGYNPKLVGIDGTQGTSGNPVLARQLLQQGLREEGWTSSAKIPPILFTYSTGSQAIDDEVTVSIQMWKTVLGIAVQPNAIDPATLASKIADTANNPQGLQFWRYTWIADYPDPQDWLTLQFNQGAQNNATNYGQNSGATASQQQAVQQLMAQADINHKQDVRLRQYNAAEQRLIRDVAWLPVYQVGAVYLLKPYVRGMIDNPLGLTPPNDWSNIYVSSR